jgi:DNA-binding MarR family transcriptional regulator
MADDHVSSILEQWRRVRPDLDVRPMGIVGRLSRLARDLEHKLNQNFARFDLDGAAFDLLAALRRQGAPYSLSPKALQFEMMISSGSTTYRLDQLEQRGLIARFADPNDRRGVRVQLTAEGLTLVDEVIVSHLELEATYLDVLSEAQKGTLEAVLTQLAQGRGL